MLVDGVYVMKSWIKYGGSPETAAHTLRISECGTKFELVNDVQGGPSSHIGGSLVANNGALELSNTCGNTFMFSFPYSTDGMKLDIVTGTSGTKYLESYVRQ